MRIQRLSRSLLVLLLSGSAQVVTSAELQSHQEPFDLHTLASVPPGWTVSITGKGNPKWEVVKEASAPSQPHAMKQSGEGTFPLLICEQSSLKDGFVQVKYKAVSGKVDQVGGVIWRCKDANNYYIARANALENNVTIYRTVDGKRMSLKNVDIPVAPAAWHVLRVDFRGNRFSVSFNGSVVLEATDDTFQDAGKVGLWTKADSVTLFDDFRFGTK